MSVSGDRERMVEWANRMRLPELSSPVDRKLLIECSRVKVLPANLQAKRKKRSLPGMNSLRRSSWKSTRRHMLVASDVLILCQVKRKATLSRRKPNPLLISLLSSSMHVEYHPNTASICLRYPAGKENKETSIQVFLPAERYEEIAEVLRAIRVPTKSNVEPLGEDYLLWSIWV